MTSHHLGDYRITFLEGSLPQVGFSPSVTVKIQKQVYFSVVNYMCMKVYGMYQLIECSLLFKRYLLKDLFYLFICIYFLYG